MFATFPEFDFRNRRILDLGCGIGGRAAWLANNGAREVVGIDISVQDVLNAAQLTDRLYPNLKNVSYHPCKEDEQLTGLGEFDVVLLLDSIEHVVSPLKAVRLARKYVKSGGRVYFSTVGWFHHAGSHLGIPFATVFFSDETLLNFVRWKVSRPDYQPTDWDSDPPVARWGGVYDLRDRPGEYLNKITVRQLRRLVRYAPYRRGRLIMIGFRNPRLRWLNPLRHIPIVNEVFHSAVRYVGGIASELLAWRNRNELCFRSRQDIIGHRFIRVRLWLSISLHKHCLASVEDRSLAVAAHNGAARRRQISIFSPYTANRDARAPVTTVESVN
jgi:SAM-dependent methyltransferase